MSALRASLLLALVPLSAAVPPRCDWEDITNPHPQGPNDKYHLGECTELALGIADAANKGLAIGDMGAFTLARALNRGPSKVTHVSLFNQNIGLAGAAELAETLKTHP